MITYRDGKPASERFYLRVTDVREIQKIENRSTNWSAKRISEKYGYIISEQRDAYEKPTGFCRVIKRERAIVETRIIGKTDVFPKYSSKDWIYYERRA